MNVGIITQLFTLYVNKTTKSPQYEHPYLLKTQVFEYLLHDWKEGILEYISDTSGLRGVSRMSHFGGRTMPRSTDHCPVSMCRYVRRFRFTYCTQRGVQSRFTYGTPFVVKSRALGWDVMGFIQSRNQYKFSFFSLLFYRQNLQIAFTLFVYILCCSLYTFIVQRTFY